MPLNLQKLLDLRSRSTEEIDAYAEQLARSGLRPPPAGSFAQMKPLVDQLRQMAAGGGQPSPDAIPNPYLPSGEVNVNDV